MDLELPVEVGTGQGTFRLDIVQPEGKAPDEGQGVGQGCEDRAGRATGRRRWLTTRSTGLQAKVLTVSDGVIAGTREDKSGAALAELLTGAGFEVVDRRVVADGIQHVGEAVVELAEGFAGLIVTTGGTGFGPRDQTPEGTRVVLDREAPGLAEAMRLVNPLGRLSRGVAGTRGLALVLNTPGSTQGRGGDRRGRPRRHPPRPAPHGRRLDPALSVLTTGRRGSIAGLALVLVATGLTGAAATATAGPSAVLVDVPPWAADEIAWVVDQGLLPPLTPTRFGPLGPMSRGHAVRMLWRISGRSD